MTRTAEARTALLAEPHHDGSDLSLGFELMGVEVAATPVTREEVVEGAVYDADEAELAAELLTAATGERTSVVCRFDASSRVRPDEPVEIAVDTSKLHLFDLETGDAI